MDISAYIVLMSLVALTGAICIMIVDMIKFQEEKEEEWK